MLLFTKFRCVFLNPHPRINFSFILKRGKEEERERDIDLREKHWIVACYTCLLSRDQSCNFSVYGMVLQPPASHHPGLTKFIGQHDFSLCIANIISHLTYQTKLLIFPILSWPHLPLSRSTTLLVFSILVKVVTICRLYRPKHGSHSWSSFSSHVISKLLASLTNSTFKTYLKSVVNLYWVYS